MFCTPCATEGGAVDEDVVVVQTTFYNACTITDPLELFLSLFTSLESQDGQTHSEKVKTHKPFDCVGTAEEARAALALAVWRYVREYLQKKESEGIVVGEVGLRKEDLPDILVGLCEHQQLPWYDVKYWLMLENEDAVLAKYGEPL